MDDIPILEVRDLRTHVTSDRGTVRAVDGVSFSVARGRTVGIVGESGCGKTMTALSVMGLLPKPQARVVGGEILFDGRDLTTLSPRELQEIRGRDIAMIFQDPMTSLNPTLTVGTQIMETLRRHEGLSRAQARSRATDLLAEVGITDPARRLDDYPFQFSGGMRQRVMIAIAISCNPKLLVADEPTTALDVTVQARILDLLHDLRDQHDMGLVLITHDMGVVADIADDTVVMYAGQIVEQADVHELFAHPEHPYTRALLGAMPSLQGDGGRDGRLAAIPGMPPSLVDPPVGCRFAARCAYADRSDGCAQGDNELRELRPGHRVRTAHPVSALTGVAS
ncbi:MAG: oligopeptide/dipeptide transporter, ATPase subunit [Modestobacter sp.]|nr:oligopeptide/dipeptide transporter, ATPase subunit [Modestobacter sp.]